MPAIDRKGISDQITSQPTPLGRGSWEAQLLASLGDLLYGGRSGAVAFDYVHGRGVKVMLKFPRLFILVVR
jgi:hypothetical protein